MPKTYRPSSITSEERRARDAEVERAHLERAQEAAFAAGITRDDEDYEQFVYDYMANAPEVSDDDAEHTDSESDSDVEVVSATPSIYSSPEPASPPTSPPAAPRAIRVRVDPVNTDDWPVRRVRRRLDYDPSTYEIEMQAARDVIEVAQVDHAPLRAELIEALTEHRLRLARYDRLSSFRMNTHM